MEQYILEWKEKTGTIFIGVLVYSIASLLLSFVAPMHIWLAPQFFFPSFVTYILLAATLTGYIIFIKGLGNFSELLDYDDCDAISRVRYGILFCLVGAVVSAIPFIGWIAGPILNIIGVIFMLTGFQLLRNCSTFPSQGRQGASYLFYAMIFNLIGNLVFFIPFVGVFIAVVLNLIAFVMTIWGWLTIKNTDPATI